MAGARERRVRGVFVYVQAPVLAARLAGRPGTPSTVRPRPRTALAARSQAPPRARTLAAIGFAVRALLLAPAACTRLDAVPPGVVTCASPPECPSGLVCHRGRCADPGAMDTTPPDLAGAVAVAPVRVRAGQPVTVTLEASELLEAPPSVSLGLVPAPSLACAATAARAYACAYTATGHENGDRGGAIAVDVRMTDRAGNATARSSVATITFDFAPPVPTLASVAYVPPASSPLAAVRRAGPGTVVRVVVSADERLGPSPAPALVARLGAVELPFALEPGGLGTAGAAFAATVPPGLPDGSYALHVTWTDDVGNGGGAVVPAAVEVKTTAPTLAVTQGALVFVRSPVGNASAEPLGAHAIPAGPYFAVEPWDPLADVTTLPEGALLLEGGGVPSAVLVQSSPAPGALVLGVLRPDVLGRFPRQALMSPDLAAVWLVGVDDAGNRSSPVRLRESEWVATSAAPAFGASPHALLATGCAGPTRAQPLAPAAVARADVQGTDALAAVSRSSIAWEEVTGSATTPSARILHALAYDAARGRVVLFGGRGPTKLSDQEELADTWEWDGTSWTLAAETGPSARSAHALVYDAARGRAVLFGGTRDGRETWEWDGASWQLVASAGPSARSSHAMAFDPGRGEVVLFGGTAGGNETWTWDGSAWTLRATAGPAARTRPAMAYDPAHDRVLLFGGAAPSGDLRDTWVWDGTGWSSTAASGPAPSSDAVMAFDPGAQRVILVSGSQTWAWTGATWAAVAPFPSPRTSPAAASDLARGRVLLFGGYGPGAPLRDTWSWDAARWGQVALAGPAGRYGVAIASDPSRGRIVMFGGSGTGETWEWNGAAWEPRAASGPGARTYAAMAHDPVHGQMILFGGSASADTWAWDGSAWTAVATSGPSARSGHAMAWDEARGRVVLFGGTTGANETWTWNGSAWSLAATTGPSARQHSAMAWDPVSQRVLLHGGGSGGGETWAWDGASWTLVATTGPGERLQHAMVHDVSRGRIVLVGGFDGAGVLDDVWEWTGTAWTPLDGGGPAGRARHGMAYDGGGRRVLVFGGQRVSSGGPSVTLGDTWALHAGADRRPALQFHASASTLGVEPAAVEAVRVRAFAGGLVRGAQGALLLGWASRGAGNEPGGWVELHGNQTAAAAAPPHLPGAPASLLPWSTSSAAEARRYLVARDGLTFQLRPAGGVDAGGSAVALDYVEVRVRYAAP